MMDASKAGYDTGRQNRFTWSGAIRPLRSARLTPCRRFRPSPCPTHYGGRSATPPSADFCSITPGVATGRAVRVVAGSGGDFRRFRGGPQSGSHDDHSNLRVRWRFRPFRAGPQFDSHCG